MLPRLVGARDLDAELDGVGGEANCDQLDSRFACRWSR